MQALLAKLALKLASDPKLAKKLISLVGWTFGGIIVTSTLIFMPIASLFGPAMEVESTDQGSGQGLLSSIIDIVGGSADSIRVWLGLADTAEEEWELDFNIPMIDENYDVTQSNMYRAIYPVYMEECQKINQKISDECERIHQEHQEYNPDTDSYECGAPEASFVKINFDSPEHLAALMAYLNDDENLLDKGFGFVWSKHKVRTFFEKYATIAEWSEGNQYYVEFHYPKILDEGASLTDESYVYPYNMHWSSDITGGGKAKNGKELFSMLGVSAEDGFVETSYYIYYELFKARQSGIGRYNGTPSGHISNADVAKQVWDFFKAKGWTDYACAALLGNIEQESTFNYRARTNHDIGLFQWTDNRSTSRMTAFLNWCARSGRQWDAVETQCEYLCVENVWYTALYRSTDRAFTHSAKATSLTDFGTRQYSLLSDAVSDFLWHWERPNYASANEDRRQGAAQDALSRFGSGTDAFQSGTKAQKLAAIYPNGVPATEAQCEASCKTVVINTLSGAKTITVNAAVADDVQAIFTEIAASGFIISDVSGYEYRDKSHATGLSSHAYGLAIDINTMSNGQYDVVNGVRAEAPNTGGPWLPGVDPLSITPDGPVVKAFEARGWTWGGDWRSKKDYMHFSFTGD
ncbi:MAG: phage tail-type lysozyme domain-containing protein [Clostridium sp.]|nr:phage tail-type lysozyme domain-containing protein [Clostridium sp.]